ncbi:hypothetical protein TEA_029943 [Camellia sinensis var. sinensis]|uniref:Uncharacterized protein n=1 Tax=Camellia sinensis var. sinensis TaxID=542762 RepID=A0A4V3WQY1_CAMSN|nr:hypothetical protein TEA_029943 [Camellia sinensis var. sinensis]
MAAANAPISMREALTLSSIGINPQFITFTHVTMESDKYICVRGFFGVGLGLNYCLTVLFLGLEDFRKDAMMEDWVKKFEKLAGSHVFCFNSCNWGLGFCLILWILQLSVWLVLKLRLCAQQSVFQLD